MRGQDYGVGITGQGGLTISDLGTLQEHAVPLPWPPGSAVGTSVCGREARLIRVAGWALGYSLYDGSLCPVCRAIVHAKGYRE